MLLVQADFSHSEIMKKKRFDVKLESLAKQVYSIDSPPNNQTLKNPKNLNSNNDYTKRIQSKESR